MIDMSFVCDDCGASLQHNSVFRSKNRNDTIELRIIPCVDCLSEARSNGWDAGQEEGYDEGHSTGKGEGYEQGKNEFFEEHRLRDPNE